VPSFGLQHKMLKELSTTYLAAAVKWYEMGVLSQGKAAELAGLSRQEFLSSLSRFGVSPFQVTPDELRQEWERE
jgi:predicted HTH domain antitoxin